MLCNAVLCCAVLRCAQLLHALLCAMEHTKAMHTAAGVSPYLQPSVTAANMHDYSTSLSICCCSHASLTASIQHCRQTASFPDHSLVTHLPPPELVMGTIWQLKRLVHVQVLQEPGVPNKQLRSRAKAVKKLGSIFSQVNRPRNRPVTNIMEEFSEVLQV